MIDIAELRRLEAEATPAPWDVSGLTVYDTCMDGVASTHSAADAALIVAMRNALPELLKALEDAEARKNALAECLAGSSNAEVSDRVRSRIKSIFNPHHGGGDVG